jgi:hypothetical protein
LFIPAPIMPRENGGRNVRRPGLEPGPIHRGRAGGDDGD